MSSSRATNTSSSCASSSFESIAASVESISAVGSGEYRRWTSVKPNPKPKPCFPEDFAFNELALRGSDAYLNSGAMSDKRGAPVLNSS